MRSSDDELKSLLSRFVQGSLWQSAAYATSRIVPSFLVIFLAVLISARELGIYSFALACFTVLQLVADMGITIALPRLIQENPSQAQQITATAFYVRIFLSSAIGVIVYAIDLKWNLLRGCGFYVALLLVTSPSTVLVFSFNARLRFMESSILTCTKCVIWFVLSIVFVYAGLTIAGPIYGFAIGFISNVFLSIYWDRLSFLSHFSFDFARQLISLGVYLAISGTFIVLIGQTGLLALGYLTHPRIVGTYKIAQTFALLPLLPAEALITPFLPILKKALTRDETHAIELLRFTMRYIILVDVLIVAVGLVLGVPVITILFREAYQGAALPLQVLLCANALGVLFNLLIATTYMTSNVRDSAMITFGVALTMITGCLLLIPHYAAVGAAYSLFMAYALGLGLITWRLRSGLGRGIWTEWRRYGIYVAAAAEVFISLKIYSWYVPINSIFRVIAPGILSCAAFFTFLIIQKGVTRQEIMNVIDVVRSGAGNATISAPAGCLSAPFKCDDAARESLDG